MLELSEALWVASSVLESSDSDDSQEDGIENDSEDADGSDDGIAQDLELAALICTQAGIDMADNTRGAYLQSPKSRDFFSIALQRPDREFRHIFRYVFY